MINRRAFVKQAIVGLGVSALSTRSWIEASSDFDIVISGGQVFDGTGGPAWTTDIGIVGDTIAALEKIPSDRGKIHIDATGLQISPGFIDIHTHSSVSVLKYPTADSRVRQGITTEITGNCGGSAAPVGKQDQGQNENSEDYPITWSDVASYFKTVEEKRISLNQAMLLGQGTLRSNVIGSGDRVVKPEELAQILRSLEEGLDQGAVGLSTGLEYVPGVYTPMEELIQMARIVARRGGFYASHVRNEEAGLLSAINEAIEIGRQTGIRVEVSHLKACGRANWNKQQAAIDLIESARKEGIEVLADAYPYEAWSTDLDVLLQPWVRDGGAEAIVGRLSDPALREQLRKEIDKQIMENDAGYDGIYVSSLDSEKNRPLIGKNLLQIAELWKIDPVDAYVRLLIEEKDVVSYIGHGIKPENVETVLSHPLVMIGSDGYSLMAEKARPDSKPHPRSYGTYPRFLGHYVRERKLMDWPAAIRKATSMPADQVGLKDRGRIARGKRADIVVFDSNSIIDEATFENPERYSKGVIHVFVNGVPVVQNEKHTGKTPGRILRMS